MTSAGDSPAPRHLPAAGRAGQNWHGSLSKITDTERRALRPIGTSTHDLAVRTGMLISELLCTDGVQLFQGLQCGPGNAPRIPHALCAGRQVVLIDSVAWPPGRYATDLAGRIQCEGVYIGQSVLPLASTARRWQQALPPGHQVSALVIVHHLTAGSVVLPPARWTDLAWADAATATDGLRQFLPGNEFPTSAAAIAALTTAASDPEEQMPPLRISVGYPQIPY